MPEKRVLLALGLRGSARALLRNRDHCDLLLECTKSLHVLVVALVGAEFAGGGAEEFPVRGQEAT
jgi:hypothetical protein